jgi:hypothetical protein
MSAMRAKRKASPLSEIANGRTIWIVGAHRGDGRRFVVQADEKLTAFLELESSIRAARHRIKR